MIFNKLQKMERNSLLVELTWKHPEKEWTQIDLANFFSTRSPLLDKSTVLPLVPMNFDKDLFIECILRALAKQFEGVGVQFYVLKWLAAFDGYICDSAGSSPLAYSLVLQLLVHLSNVESFREIYNVEKELEEDVAKLCRMMQSVVPFYIRHVDASSRLKRFLLLPNIVALFYGELERYGFSELHNGNIESFIRRMVIYATDAQFSDMHGWVVVDGIVMVLGNLPTIAAKQRANEYTLVLRETMHFLARFFSKNFAFSSPGKNSEFKDADEQLAAEGKGLELGRSAEIALLGMEVDWEKMPGNLAERFVDEVENEKFDGPYLRDERTDLRPMELLSIGSGFSIDWASHKPKWCGM